jgi:hypothetical protein
MPSRRMHMRKLAVLLGVGVALALLPAQVAAADTG